MARDSSFEDLGMGANMSLEIDCRSDPPGQRGLDPAEAGLWGGHRENLLTQADSGCEPLEAAVCSWASIFRRVGEAANPGPAPGTQVFQAWRSANITGFCHAGVAMAWNADVLGITELRGSPEEAARIGKRFGKAVSCSLPDEEGKRLAAIFFVEQRARRPRSLDGLDGVCG